LSIVVTKSFAKQFDVEFGFIWGTSE